MRESPKIVFNCVANAVLELKDSWHRTVHLSVRRMESSPFKHNHHLNQGDVGS